MKSFEIDPSLAWNEGVIRCAVQELESARQGLKQKQDLPAAIHELRKSIKRVRALLRLVRPAWGKDYKKLNRMLRDAGRELSEARDQTALLETLRDLKERCPAEHARKLEQLAQRFELVEEKVIDPAALAAPLRRVDEKLGAAAKRITRLEKVKKSDLRQGLLKTYGRAQESFQEARAGQREHLHDFRKRVKYHRYQLRLLRASHRKLVSPERKLFKRLGESLGEDHDLLVLCQVIRCSGKAKPDEATEGLLQWLAERRRTLQERALDEAPLAFVESPKAHARRLAGYLETASEAAGKSS